MDASCSPFFDRRKRSRCRENAARSQFFERSPCSTFGAIETSGSLLNCLTGNGGNEVIAREECYAQEHPLDPRTYCVPCRDLINKGTLHFRSCSIFCERWQQWTPSGSRHQHQKHCLQLAEQRIDHSVRHLCQEQCYLKAFAPQREWLDLRSSIRESINQPVSELLRGWRCVLVRKDDQSVVHHEAPDGEMFDSKNQVMKYLAINDRENNPSRWSSSPRKRRRLFSSHSDREWVTTPRSRAISVTSPFGFLEELFTDDPWRLLLCAILLNRTRRSQVDKVMYAFLNTWPTAESVLGGDLECMGRILQPLGIHYRRSEGIVRFTKQYLEMLDRKESSGVHNAAFQLSQQEIMSLYNCGEYAFGAYRLFILQDVDFDPEDHALRSYAEYQRSVSS